MTSLDQTLARLLTLHPRLIDLSLDRMWRILDSLDHPERKLPPVIHVAGTNGKGSDHRLHARDAGGRRQARARLYLAASRALQRAFPARPRPAAASWSTIPTLEAALAECERANAGEPITVFEITTAAAFLLFARQPADLLLLEVGLGGRLDATNVVERPLLSVITPVSLDHADYLGDTLEQVAGEKAGILKRGRTGGDRAAAGRGTRRDRTAGCVAARAAQYRRASNGWRARSMAGWSIRTTTGCSICRRRSLPAGISSSMPAPRSRLCARPG